jgi:ribonuclease BN (tRNA processing enzyme)
MHTAALVEYRGTRVMIDCGATWLGKVDHLRPDAIAITHAHPDHAFGLASGSPCPVYATRSAWTTMRRFPIPPERRRTLRLRKSVAIDGIVLEAFAVVHSIRAPAVGYRVSAGGVKVFYVPDVVSIPARSAALRDIALYVGDGATITRNMVRRERKTGALFGHTTIARQLAWCRDGGVARMIVTHCGSAIVGGDEAAAIAKIEALAARNGVAVAVAHDGLELVLRSRPKAREASLPRRHFG